MVPLTDLARRAARLREPYADAFARVMASGWFLLGAETDAFEAEFAAFCGAPHAVAVASGTDALALTLRAWGVGPGDEVIVPAFTAVPTAAAVCVVGATPVPVDVDPGTAAIDVAAAAAAVTDRTKLAIAVHLYGRPAPVAELAAATRVPVLEDAAQAHGALDWTYTQGPEGASIATAYSFYPTKNLGGIGDGGAVVTSDAELADRIRLLRHHGMRAQYVHDVIAQNSRMSELEAACLRAGLAVLDDDTARRRAISAAYRAAAPELCWHADHLRHVHHLAVFRTGARDAVMARLAERGVASGIHYPRAVTQQPAYVQFTRAECPHAEAWAASCVTVPCVPELTDDEVAQVCEALAGVEPQ